MNYRIYIPYVKPDGKVQWYILRQLLTFCFVRTALTVRKDEGNFSTFHGVRTWDVLAQIISSDQLNGIRDGH